MPLHLCPKVQASTGKEIVELTNIAVIRVPDEFIRVYTGSIVQSEQESTREYF